MSTRWCGVVLLGAYLNGGCTTASRPPLPEGAGAKGAGANRQDIELEVKWKTDDATFARMFEAFHDGAVVHELRCSSLLGAVRLYVDRYLDTPDNILAAKQHVLRHRQRLVTSANLRLTDSIEQLESAQWSVEIERLQYKSAPVRLGPIWSRAERGHSALSSTALEAALRCDRIEWSPPEDNPISLLLEEHPGLDCAKLVERKKVVQFRYHIVLSNQAGKPRFMISFDRVRGAGTSSVNSVELEASKELIDEHREVAELTAFAAILERDFQLEPVSSSKGLPASSRKDGEH